MKKILNCSRFILAGQLALSLFAAQQLMAAEDKDNRGQFTSADYKFVCAASEGGTMEVTLGQLAAEKGADQSVRDFGQHMVQDHQRLNQELTQLATQKGATLPESSTKKDEKMTEHLKSLAGADFDKAYIKDMVRDHKKDIKEFQRVAEKADDADLKAWASKTLPTLQEHLRMAESADATVNGARASAKD